MNGKVKARAPWRRWASWIGGAIGAAALAWVFVGIDYAALDEALGRAKPGYLALVPIAIALEQLVRAWKWRQVLHPLRHIGTFRLFGAIMAGYLVSLLVPFGLNPLARSWLIARLEGLTMSAVLASVAIDRLLDGLIFAGLVLVVVALAAFPDPSGDIRLGLVAGATVSLFLLGLAFTALRHHKRHSTSGAGWFLGVADRLPSRFRARARTLLLSFADGIVWPQEEWRRAGIVIASILIKLIAASELLWAGLAFGVVLPPLAYFVLLAILGFLVILTHLARIPGGFIVGAVFALGLFGIGEAQAVLMVGTVVTASVATIGITGAVTLWRHGVALGELRAPKARGDVAA